MKWIWRSFKWSSCCIHKHSDSNWDPGFPLKPNSVSAMVSPSTTLFLSLLLSFFAFFSQSESKSHPPKVSIDLYYETLCPDSSDFIVNHLPKIFTTDLIPIVHLKFVPWGNAKIRPNTTTFDCQVPFLPNFTFYYFFYLFIYLFIFIAAWTKWVLP